MNYSFNIDDWLWRFPLAPEPGVYRATPITGPRDICTNEQLRREIHDQYIWGEGVPVDVFIMAEGEPADRNVTKIGGLPYRPADAPWPETADGQPLRFIAQFDFTDSRDITGPLPDDVLLVFGNYADEWIDELHFEWRPLGLANLVAADQLPEDARPLPACYGHRFRAASFPKAYRSPQSPLGYPLCQGFPVWCPYHLEQYQATQIGSAPFFIQKMDPLPGRTLCAINSVCPDVHGRYPWVNRTEPLLPENERRLDPPYLMLADTGCIYISIDDDGALHWNWSCY